VSASAGRAQTPATDAGAPRRAGPVLVTGATGFIGGRLAARLAADGRPTRCLARAGNDTAQLERLDVEVARGDLRDAASLRRAVDGCASVVHCAALVSDWATVQEIREANVLGTRRLLAACAAARVRRFVHVSSTDVYGHPGGGAVDERYRSTTFRNWYSQSKREAEAEVRAAGAGGVREAGAGEPLETVILRPATVYGPGSRDVIGEIARALRARQMLLVAGGRADAGLCHVDNLLDAVLLALELPAAAGGLYNVSDGLEVSWRRFTDDLAAGLGCPPARLSLPYPLAAAIAVALERGYRLLRRATGLRSPALLSRQAVQVLGRDQRFSSERLRRELGWEPRVDYQAGLAGTLAWLRGFASDTPAPLRRRAGESGSG